MSPTPKIKPAETEPAASITREGFVAMQTAEALEMTAPYHEEECEALLELLDTQANTGEPVDHVIAIGCAHLRYASTLLSRGVTYTGIEPTLDPINGDMQESMRNVNVHVVAKNFQDVTQRDLPADGKKLFFFLFNVFPYIDSAKDHLRKISAPGDIVLVSAWNQDSAFARDLQDYYYDYLSDRFNCVVSRAKTRSYTSTLDHCADYILPIARQKGSTTDIMTFKRF